MKKTIRVIIAVFTAAFMCAAFAACDEEKTNEDALVKDIFEKMTASGDYAQWKSDMKDAGTTVTEKLDGDSIVFHAESSEEYGTNGEFAFKRDGDYIVYTPADKDDFSGYGFAMEILRGIAGHYGMVYREATGYLAGATLMDIEDKYMIIDEETGVTKLFIAEKWDLSALDTMYINEKALTYTEPLGEQFANNIVQCGRIAMFSYGDANHVQMIFMERGAQSSDITYQSIIAAVTKLQPKGYETFLTEFTELKEASGEGYKVTMELDKDVASEHALTAEEGCSYVTVVFGAAE